MQTQPGLLHQFAVVLDLLGQFGLLVLQLLTTLPQVFGAGALAAEIRADLREGAVGLVVESLILLPGLLRLAQALPTLFEALGEFVNLRFLQLQGPPELPQLLLPGQLSSDSRAILSQSRPTQNPSGVTRDCLSFRPLRPARAASRDSAR
jgi:hypothetical protein